MTRAAAVYACAIVAAALQAGNEWEPVEGVDEFGVEKDAWNHAKFPAVKTMALRIEAQLRPEVSGGMLEWRVSEE
jgi:hypothetical protein